MDLEAIIWESCVLHMCIWFPPPRFPGAWGGWVLSWVYFLCQLSFIQLYFPSFCLGCLPFSSPGSAPAPLPPFPAGLTCWHGCWPKPWELGHRPLQGPGPLPRLAPCLGHADFKGSQKPMPGGWEPPFSGLPGAPAPGGGRWVSALGWDEGGVLHPGGSCCFADPCLCFTCFFPTPLPEMKSRCCQ